MGVTESGSDRNAPSQSRVRQHGTSAAVEVSIGVPRFVTPRAITSGHPVAVPSDGPLWRQLPADLANPVKAARRYSAHLLAEVAKTDSDHVDDVVLAASELVTNAIRHAIGEGPLWIGIAVRPRWTHLYVIDPDPTVPALAPIRDDDLALSGRGVPIVDQLGLLWFVSGCRVKTAHAVIMRAGEKLTDDERDALTELTIT
jgi:anti-sigma regulatory factor (Ser/Thr protein kinase)